MGLGGCEGIMELVGFDFGLKKDGIRKFFEEEVKYFGKEWIWYIWVGEFDLNMFFVVNKFGKENLG